MEELETLNVQMQAVAMSINKAVSDRQLSIDHDTYPFPSGNVHS